MQIRALAIVYVVIFWSIISLAQAPGGAGAAGGGDGLAYQPMSSEIGLHVGSLLPNQIGGVTEILPVWGFRYGFGRSSGAIELGFNNSRGEGVVFSTIYATLRQDFMIDTNFLSYMGLGLDIHQFKPSGMKEKMTGGGHITGGFMTPLSSSTWFRTGMTFNVGPGTSLYIEFGFAFRFPEGGGGDE